MTETSVDLVRSHLVDKTNVIDIIIGISVRFDLIRIIVVLWTDKVRYAS